MGGAGFNKEKRDSTPPPTRVASHCFYYTLFYPFTLSHLQSFREYVLRPHADVIPVMLFFFYFDYIFASQICQGIFLFICADDTTSR